MFLMPAIIKLLRLPSTQSIVLDQCMFGLHDPVSKLKYRKRTRFVGNLPSLPDLVRGCDKSHTHEPIIGQVKHNQCWVQRSTLAGVYPPNLCKQLVKLTLHDLATASLHRRRRLAQAF